MITYGWYDLLINFINFTNRDKQFWRFHSIHLQVINGRLPSGCGNPRSNPRCQCLYAAPGTVVNGKLPSGWGNPRSNPRCQCFYAAPDTVATHTNCLGNFQNICYYVTLFYLNRISSHKHQRNYLIKSMIIIP